MNSTISQVVRDTQQRWYGKYRGFVVDNQDPEQRGRLRLRVPSVFSEEITGWALPCLPFGGKAAQGLFMVPEPESQVWVEFEEGIVTQPIWSGVFYQQQSDVPEDAQHSEPTTRLLQTPAGHILQFDDADGAERFRLYHPAATELSIDEQGSVKLQQDNGAQLSLDASANEVVLSDSNGNRLTMNSSGTVVEDANGNRISMAAAGITVEGQQITIQGSQVAVGGSGGEPLIKGSSFLALFATHVHTCTAPGSPTSPPIPQGEMSTLTTKTTAS
ncbi:MAG: hypothetical protein Tsb002_21250 [Wenzhouxiangellaceae bacterium]